MDTLDAKILYSSFFTLYLNINIILIEERRLKALSVFYNSLKYKKI